MPGTLKAVTVFMEFWITLRQLEEVVSDNSLSLSALLVLLNAPYLDCKKCFVSTARLLRSNVLQPPCGKYVYFSSLIRMKASTRKVWLRKQQWPPQKLCFISLFLQMQRPQMYVWTVWQVCVIVENDSYIVENKWTEDICFEIITEESPSLFYRIDGQRGTMFSFGCCGNKLCICCWSFHSLCLWHTP